MKEKLLISACFLGRSRYDGRNNFLGEDVIAKLSGKFDLIPVCPEADGGLPTPRDPSERLGDKVVSCKGVDVTKAFAAGANIALAAAKENGCKRALLKEKSPSCGFGRIYDGTFSMTLVPGSGVTAELLSKNGIEIIGESRINELI